MTRRSFITRLMAAWAALWIPYPEEGPESICCTLDPNDVRHWLAAEQARIAAMIRANLMKPSPWIQLLSRGTFPMRAGETRQHQTVIIERPPCTT